MKRTARSSVQQATDALPQVPPGQAFLRQTLAPCPFCGVVVCMRVWKSATLRYDWDHWRSPVLGEEHHCAPGGRPALAVAPGAAESETDGSVQVPVGNRPEGSRP